MNIEDGKNAFREFQMTSLLSFRGKLTEAELREISRLINDFIVRGGYVQTGPIESCALTTKQKGEEQVLTAEMLVPLGSGFAPPEDCAREPEFILTYTITVWHDGNPAGLCEEVNKILAYIQEHGHMPMPVGHSASAKYAETPIEIDNMVIDIHLGISRNSQ